MPGRKKINIKGIVQGVGFRPFVYRLATNLSLTGFVCNTTDGVDIEIEGREENLQRFIEILQKDKPPAARIDGIKSTDLTATGEDIFSIVESKVTSGFTQISPDIATCTECISEIRDPQDRRSEFPFTNCTNCGPRYSIIIDTPYDRGRTSMSRFKMCAQCSAEFNCITDRRFHAQPDCCPVCGPSYRLFSISGREIPTDDPVSAVAELLKKGHLVAVKGIGGFHIACDAQNCDSVRRLRQRKNRPTKPLALMVRPSLVHDIVHLTDDEEEMLKSPAAPIILLRKKESRICDGVAPKNPYLGVMLPYAPVHHLILNQIPFLVMTRANIQDEPIVKDASAVRQKLKSLVSHYADHDRAIENRCDDSVGYYLPQHGFSIIRRSRGYIPVPVELPTAVKPTLGVGPYLKNTFALANGREAYLSPHIGDLDNLETLQFFDEMLEKYKRWFRIRPELIVHDLHPDYLSTKIAQGLPGTKKSVQHHVAHFVSCLGENQIKERCIGIAFDGTGYGYDGKIWGCEFFVGDIHEQKRAAHLQYLPLPGGESSIKKPYRIAVAYVYSLLKEKLTITDDAETRIIHRMIDENSNVVYTSSMGRLFDCVSALLGITKEITYEAEAAINLEYTAQDATSDYYPFTVKDEPTMVIEAKDILKAIVSDMKKQIAPAVISAKFHNTIAEFSFHIADRLRTLHGLNSACLSGGVFQNRLLLNMMINRLKRGGFNVYTHKHLPNNDGCISYGQVIAANAEELT
ncbi:MAG: carbamoyltransferase HypF [candidate division WOR-3 bacterium]|nr:MAG: carbamoyltransferase HypF [candidate division WOR-3 bacterium]